MRNTLLALLFALPLTGIAADKAPVKSGDNEAVTTGKPAEAPRKKPISLKQYGEELKKLGSGIGKGTVKTGKAAGEKVSSDVKKKNFQPRPPEVKEPSTSDRGGTN